MQPAESAFERGINAASELTGRAAAWLTLLMVIATCIVVVLRYLFDTGVIWLQESVTWMHAAVFMLGAAYTLKRDEHVRVDVFYRELPARRQALVDLLGVLLFVFPLCGFLGIASVDYVAASWEAGEVSRNAGGLPYPFVPLLKSTLLLMPLAVLLQGIAMALGALARLRSR